MEIHGEYAEDVEVRVAQIGRRPSSSVEGGSQEFGIERGAGGIEESELDALVPLQHDDGEIVHASPGGVRGREYGEIDLIVWVGTVASQYMVDVM